MTLKDINEKLEQLRSEWKLGKGERVILKRRARALEIARELILKRSVDSQAGAERS